MTEEQPANRDSTEEQPANRDSAENQQTSPVPASAELLLAVGMPLGPTVEINQRPDQVEASIRSGEFFHFISLAHYALWAEALVPKHRSALLESASRRFAQPADAIAELEEEGLLVCLTGVEERDLDILRHHRMHRLGIGLGNSLAHPYSYVIATPDLVPAARVDVLLYLLWAESNSCDTLWNLCSHVAIEMGSQPDELRRRALQGIPVLMTAGVCLLEAI